MKMLIYRDNDFWTALHGDLVEMVERINPDAGECVEQIFPASTGTDEIKMWVEFNRDSVAKAIKSGWMGSLFTDTTVQDVVAACGIEGYPRNLTKDVMGRAFEAALAGKDPSSVYRELFKRLISAATVTRVLIVREYLADYNPLSLLAYVSREAQNGEGAVKAYSDAFVSLMPSGTVCEVISIDDLGGGFRVKERDLLIFHHHAMQRIPGDSHQLRIGSRLRERALSITSYLSGFIPKVASFTDVSDLIREDIMDIARGIIAKNGIQKL